MKATRQADVRSQFSFQSQGLTAPIPHLNPGAPVSPLSALAGGNEHELATTSNFGMFGPNSLEGACQHSMNMVERNSQRGGALRNWVSPYSDPELEYVYLGSPQTPLEESPQQWPVPEPALNNLHNFQPTPGNVYFDPNGLATAPMGTAQPGYMMQPGNDFQSQLHPAQSFNRAASPGLYGTLTESELYYDDIWSILESDSRAQRSDQFDVSSVDLNMVEDFGFDSGVSMQTPVASQSQLGGTTPGSVGNTAGNYKTWGLPDVVDSTSSGRAGYTFTSTGQTSTRGDLHGSLPRQPHEQGHAHHHSEVAQSSDQILFQHGVPLPIAELGGTGQHPRFGYMDMVIEESISDGISSTSPADGHSQRDAHTQIPYGYVPNSNAFRAHADVQRSSRPENNFREKIQPSHQQRLENREPHNASAGSTHNDRPMAMENDFSQLMAPGLPGIRHLGEPRWAEQLLNLCAGAIASKNISRTQHLMWVLNDLASVVGDANQRFAAYGLRALFCRITGRMEAAATFMRPRHHDQEKSFGPKTVHRALVKFHEHVPWHQNCYSTASQTLLEVCAGKNRLHLIDIGAGKGIEWPIFIDALVSRPGGPPAILRITMIRDLRREELNMHTAKMVNSEAADFMTRLVKFASVLGLHVEVNLVTKPLECVTQEDLRLRDGEILAVVCQFRLHRLSEEVPERPSSNSPPQLSPRDEFLDFLFQLNPHVFIVSDNDSNHCSHDFLTRFQNLIRFWWHLIESMDLGYNGRDSDERQIIEYEAGMMILNTVACEGIARIERNEPYSQWKKRILRAGFVPKDLSDDTRKVCQTLVHNHGQFWSVVFSDPNVVHLHWRQQPTTFTSVWQMPGSCSKNMCKCSMLHS